MTREQWATSFLLRIHAPLSRRNYVAMVAWIASEGGDAAWNPLNTTKRELGSTDYNSIGVQEYVSEEQGLQASIDTLHESGKGYEHIISRLRDNRWPSTTLRAVYDSSWGTVKLPFLLRSVKRSYDFYASQPIATQ